MTILGKIKGPKKVSGDVADFLKGNNYESVDTGGEDGLGAATHCILPAKRASISLVVDTLHRYHKVPQVPQVDCLRQDLNFNK